MPANVTTSPHSTLTLLKGKGGASASGNGTNSGGTSSSTGGDALEQLFSALLAYAQEGNQQQTGAGANAGGNSGALAFLNKLGIDQSDLSKVSASLGGSVDLSALIASAGGKAGASGKPADGKNDSPIAAVIDNLLAGLKDLASQVTAGTAPDAGTVGKANKALSALSDLLTALQTNTGAAGAAGGQDAPKLDPALLDRLNTLSDTLKSLSNAPALKTAGDGTGADIKALLAKIGNLEQRTNTVLAGTPGTAQTASTTSASQLSTAQMANPATVLSGGHAATRNSGTDTQPVTSATGPGNGSAVAAAAQSLNTNDKGQSSADQNGKQPGAKSDIVASVSKPDAAAGTSANADGSGAAAAQAGLGHANTASAAFKPATAAYQAQQSGLNLPGIAVAIVRQVNAGNSRFAIRLDPPEMGKIDVSMHMDKSGGVHAHLTVERTDTLDLLQRDARGLEKALAQAGLDSSRTNLQFSLKQNPFSGQQFAGQHQNQGNSNPQPAATLFANDASETGEPTAAVAAQLYRGFASPGGINLLA